jgi:S1-C subfamily serine protease
LISGDIIVSLGDQHTAGIDGLHRLLTADSANKSRPLQVLRGVERKILEIVPLPKDD